MSCGYGGGDIVNVVVAGHDAVDVVKRGRYANATLLRLRRRRWMVEMENKMWCGCVCTNDVHSTQAINHRRLFSRAQPRPPTQSLLSVVTSTHKCGIGGVAGKKLNAWVSLFSKKLNF